MSSNLTWRAALGALGALVATGAIVASCTSRTRQRAAPPPPIGLSTAPGPSNPDVPPPDSAGVPQPSQPTPPVQPPTTSTERPPITTASLGQEPMDAGTFDGMLPDAVAR
jgi:hypothetical protein